jgi:hypothetical protein
MMYLFIAPVIANITGIFQPKIIVVHIGTVDPSVLVCVFLQETVDGEFTTTADIANTVAFVAGFETNALTGQSIVVSHGWSMI